MRKSRNLNACISLLEDLQSGGSVDPEQKEVVGHVVDELKQIRRKPSMRQDELHESIRNIVEKLVRTFNRRS